MKKIIMFLLGLPVLLMACNNSGKDSVAKADSINEVRLDSALNRKDAAIDEVSSVFLVRVVNGGMAEIEMAYLAQQRATYESVKDFAAMLYKAYSDVNDKVKYLANQRKITVPVNVSEDKQKEINDLKKNAGKAFDKEFIKVMIENHEASIDMFEKTRADTKDGDIAVFINTILPAMKTHLDMAKSLQKSIGSKNVLFSITTAFLRQF